MYVAVKGGERAIDNAHALLAEKRRGSPGVPSLTLDQIIEQMALAVDRVMTEGGVYDKRLAALAIKQARGDLVEAVFLLRAYRTTLPRIGYAEPLETARMVVRRRISATFKDLPGGQLLGPTFDYTHRLLDFSLAADADSAFAGAAPTDGSDDNAPATTASSPAAPAACPRVTDILNHEGLIEVESDDGAPPADLTKTPLSFPAGRDVRLQALARGDEGFLLGLAYSTQRGFGRTHPFAGEIRMGDVSVEFVPEELGFPIEIATVTVTECQMINQFQGSKTRPPQFTRGYGLTFGHCERKSMAMALVDRSMRAEELGEAVQAPAQDQEFVLYHADNVQATGFVEHLKLPHYVDFQSELELVRRLRTNALKASTAIPTAAE